MVRCYVKVEALNMLPELIRMACTAYGAWGPATTDAHLVQVIVISIVVLVEVFSNVVIIFANAALG